MSIPFKLTKVPCSRCLKLAKAGKIRIETVQPLPEGAFAPLARDGSGKCCRDCASADGLMARMKVLDFLMARIAVGNDRQEQYRLPGMNMGLVMAGFVAPSEPGDLEAQYAWLGENDWFGVDDDRRNPAG